MGKTGLKVKEVSKDHFSSRPTSAKSADATKFSVRVIEASNLLASDVETGKSDPICFIWCGLKEDLPNFSVSAEDALTSGFMLTSVCPITVNPRWDEEFIFPLDSESLDTILSMNCYIYCRDEDISSDGTTSYDELGMLEIPLKDLILKGKRMHGNTFMISAAWYNLVKSPGMRRIDGQMKINLSISFANNSSLFAQLNATSAVKTEVKELKTVEEFTENLQASLNTNLRPTSAKARPLSASLPKSGKDVPPTPSKVTQQKAQTMDGLKKSSVAAPIRSSRSNLNLSQDFGPPASVMSSIQQTGDNESMFDFGLNSPNYLLENEIDPLDPIIESNDVKDGVENVPRYKEKLFDDEVTNELEIIKSPVDIPFLEKEPQGKTKVPVKDTSPHPQEGKDKLSPVPVTSTDLKEPVVVKDGVDNSALGDKATKSAKQDLSKPDDVKPDASKPIPLSDTKQDASKLTPVSDTKLDASKVSSSNTTSNKQTEPSKPAVDNSNTSFLQAFEKLKPISRGNSQKNMMPSEGDKSAPVDVSVAKGGVVSAADKTKPPPEKPIELRMPTKSTEPDQALVKKKSESKLDLATQSAKEYNTFEDDSLVKAGGNATAAAKMLRELGLQRQLFQKGLADLSEVTQKALAQLTQRIENIETMQTETLSNTKLALVEETGKGTGISRKPLSAPKKVVNPKNAREPGGIKEFRRKSRELYQDRDEDVSNENFVVTSPKKQRQEVDTNKFDPNYHSEESIRENLPPVMQEKILSIQEQQKYSSIPQKMNKQQPPSPMVQVLVPQPAVQYAPQEPEPMPSAHIDMAHGVDWTVIEALFQMPQQSSDHVHLVFDTVLSRGTHEDFVRLLKLVGPKPEILSFGMRSRAYDAIATLLMQGRYVERCLVWVLALVRGKMIQEITQHTQRSILECLRRLSLERSRRGLLAGLLENSINKSCTSAGEFTGMLMSPPRIL